MRGKKKDLNEKHQGKSEKNKLKKSLYFRSFLSSVLVLLSA
jgi:hypothetical protein